MHYSTPRSSWSRTVAVIRIPRLRARRRSASLGSAGHRSVDSAAGETDGLAAFASEAQPGPQAAPRAGRRWRLLAGLAVVLATTAAFQLAGQSATDVSAGVLTVTTEPAGAGVWIDGRARGRTPLAISLPPGNYILDIRAGGRRRVLPVSLAAGGAAHHYVEWSN